MFSLPPLSSLRGGTKSRRNNSDFFTSTALKNWMATSRFTFLAITNFFAKISAQVEVYKDTLQ